MIKARENAKASGMGEGSTSILCQTPFPPAGETEAPQGLCLGPGAGWKDERPERSAP